MGLQPALTRGHVKLQFGQEGLQPPPSRPFAPRRACAKVPLLRLSSLVVAHRSRICSIDSEENLRGIRGVKATTREDCGRHAQGTPVVWASGIGRLAILLDSGITRLGG